MRIRHVVITRFNLQPWKGDRPHQHLDPDWLEGRLEAFRRTCAPCLEAQTVTDFDWHLIIDPATPLAFRAELRRVVPWITLVEVPSHAAKGQAARQIVLDACANRPTDLVVQSRLDSDDAVAPTYVEALRSRLRPGQLEFLAFRRGYQLDLDSGHAVSRTWDSSPFMSLAQPPTRHPVSVYDIPHFKVRRVASLRSIDEPGMWVQLLHGRNVSSELLPGRPVAAKRLLARFPIDPSLVAGRDARESIADSATWLGAVAGEVLTSRRLTGVLPPALVTATQRRRRRARLAGALAAVRQQTPEQLTDAHLDALLDAWSGDHRTPATQFIRDLASVAAGGGNVVECGAGVSTLLLGAWGSTSTWTLEPDRAWREQVGELLAGLGLNAQRGRLLASWDELPAAARACDLAAIIAARSGPVGSFREHAYDLVPELVDRLRPGGTVLLDDAHEALAHPEVAQLLDRGRLSWEVVPAPIKPFIRGRVPLPRGSHVANVRNSSLPESSSP